MMAGRGPLVWVASAAAAVLLAAGSTYLIVQAGPLSSTARCEPTAVVGSRVEVTLVDHGGSMGGGGMMGGGMMMNATVHVRPSTIAAGTVTFIVDNVGSTTHELIVLPAAGAPGSRTVGSDSKVDEASSVGEASKPCGAGAGDGLQPGDTGWVTVKLSPGAYELVCNEPGHYQAGMYSTLTVQ